MWVTLNDQGEIAATWYEGCVQSFNMWRRAVRSLGMRPYPARVTFKVPNKPPGSTKPVWQPLVINGKPTRFKVYARKR
jgi:hypothetical protein